MKRKKLWIILVSVMVGILAVFTGGYFLTKLSTVSVEFRTRLGSETRLEEGILDRVKESGDFDYSASVLFLDAKENIDNIEKKHPYVKVEQVIRKFPNKLCIYISERIPKYRVKDDDLLNAWYILDDEFKVLDCVTEEDDLELFLNNTVEIQYMKVNSSEGEFLESNSEFAKLNSIMSGVYGKTKDYFAITSINYSKESDTYYLSTKSSSFEYEDSCELQIVGSSNLTEKAFKVTTVFVEKNFDGMDIDLTKKNVIICDNDGCHIEYV